MEPSQSLPTSSDRHTFVNLRVYDERDTTFTTAEILSAAAVTHKWCIPWAEAVSYEQLLDTLTSLLGYNAHRFRISVHTEEGYRLERPFWDSYVNLLPTIQIIVLDPKPHAPKGQLLVFIASISELDLRFELGLDPGTDMNGLHRAMISRARQQLPEQPGRRRLSSLRVFCDGELCFPTTRDSMLKVGNLESLVLECRPVWMDI